MQTYLIIRFLVDKNLVDDCYRAYAYFRWVDDVIDDSSTTNSERVAFIQRQRALVDGLYKNKSPECLLKQEELIVDLINNDRIENSGLRSFIENFLAIIEFDTQRRGHFVTQNELRLYSNRIGIAVTDAIQYFIKNGHPYPKHPNQYAAATAAHLTHILRDIHEDFAVGYINIPAEYMHKNNLNPEHLDDYALQNWVHAQVKAAREGFRLGKHYIDQLEVLHCKIAAHLFCDRFEVVLNSLERSDYSLHASLNERSKLPNWMGNMWVVIRVTIQHLAGRLLGRR